MTKKATFTQAAVRRNIRAAQEMGLEVAEIRADGTIVFNSPSHQRTRLGIHDDSRSAEAARWGDAA